jgi:hypothetical protein
MLALAPGVGYIHEPLSGAPFDHFFTVVTRENESTYLPGLTRTLEFRYNLASQLATVRTPRAAARTVRDAAQFARSRLRGERALLKDPIALLSAEWLAERFDMDVVVLIRHPAAFVSSVRRLGWAHSFDTFLDERLLRGPIGRFEAEIRGPGDPLERAALLWRILYTAVDDYRSRHDDWVFLRHEDASREPLATFESLFARLGLDLTPQARAAILAASSGANPEAPESTHAIRVDSAANAKRWRRELDPGDVERIRELTQDVWPRFYDDEDW